MGGEVAATRTHLHFEEGAAEGGPAIQRLQEGQLGLLHRHAASFRQGAMDALENRRRVTLKSIVPPPAPPPPPPSPLHPNLPQPAGGFPESSRYRLRISSIMWTLFLQPMLRTKPALSQNDIISPVEPVNSRGHIMIFESQCNRLCSNSRQPKSRLCFVCFALMEERLF